MTVTKTNCYAEWFQNSFKHLHSCRLIFRSWKSWQKRKYCSSGVIHTQCLIQNPKLQSYCSTKKVLLKPNFSDVITSQSWYSHIDYFISMVMKDSYNRSPRHFKIFALIYKKFQELFLPNKDIALDKSVTLWKGCHHSNSTFHWHLHNLWSRHLNNVSWAGCLFMALPCLHWQSH